MIIINKKVTVLIFTQSLEKGGAEKQAVLLSNLLSETYNVILIVFYPSSLINKTEYTIESKVSLYFLHGNFFNKVIKLYKIIKETSPNILFNYLLLPNLLGGILSKIINGSISIGGIRSAVLDKKKIKLNRFAHNYLNKKTIFNNYLGYDLYSSLGFKKDRALVINNGINVNTEIIVRKKKLVPNILSVGRFEAVKDYYTALKAIKKLLNSGMKFKYNIIGWGSLQNQIMHWISELEIPSENIELIINPSNIEYYYLNSDIFIQTSLFEGLSNTILEAMSYSLPIIATDVGDNSKLVKNEYNGFLVKVKDSDLIVKHLIEMLSNYDNRIRYGQNSYKIIKENYSVEAMKINYINLINMLTNG